MLLKSIKRSDGGDLLVVVLVVGRVVVVVEGARDALVRVRAAEALQARHLRGQRVGHARRRDRPHAARRRARAVAAVARRGRAGLPQWQVH